MSLSERKISYDSEEDEFEDASGLNGKGLSPSKAESNSSISSDTTPFLSFISLIGNLLFLSLEYTLSVLISGNFLLPTSFFLTKEALTFEFFKLNVVDKSSEFSQLQILPLKKSLLDFGLTNLSFPAKFNV